MLKILNAEPKDYSQEAVRILESLGSVDNGPLSRKKLKSVIGNYDVLIIRLNHKIDAEVLEHSNLKAVVTATTGLNHIDLEEAKKRHIAVLSLQGETEFLNTIHATAEHTMALMLALARRIPLATRDVEAGHWRRDAFKGTELHGKTLGIIGYGRLGKKVAEYAAAFGMKVLTHDKNLQGSALHKLLAQADIVSLHVSYSPENTNMMGNEEFRSMKKGVFFINTSRGELVNENALLNALQKGWLSGAALDVMAGENTGKSNWLKKNPLLKYARRHSNLLITPHIGGATGESMEKTEIFMARKLQNWARENLKL